MPDSYSQTVLDCLSGGPRFASELPIPYERVPDIIAHMAPLLKREGFRITGRWVHVPGRFFRSKQRLYKLERVT